MPKSVICLGKKALSIVKAYNILVYAELPTCFLDLLHFYRGKYHFSPPNYHPFCF